MSFVLRTARFAAARPVIASRAFGSSSVRALKESDRSTYLPLTVYGFDVVEEEEEQ